MYLAILITACECKGTTNFSNMQIFIMKKSESSPSERASVVVIGHATSVEETVNTFSHELRHLVDDIAAVCGITVSGEEVAYLTGDIALTLASSLLHIVCECPICSSHE